MQETAVKTAEKKPRKKRRTKAQMAADETARESRLGTAMANQAARETTVEEKPKAKEVKGPRQGIYLKIKGTYYKRDGTETLKSTFDDEIQLTDDPGREMPRQSELRRLVQKKIAPVYMEQNQDKYPGFSGLRTLVIYDSSREGVGKKPSKPKGIDEMTFEELERYVAREDLNTEVRMYSSIQEARSEVRDEIENRKISLKAERERADEEALKEEESYEGMEDLVEFGSKIEA